MKFDFRLWLAQGFGVGRIPFAPGTAGSLAGLLWFFLLLAAGNVRFYLIGLAAGLALSVWICGQAEKILQRTDPASVVLDEIAALPICFASWILIRQCQGSDWPGAGFFLRPDTWYLTLGIFAAFRLFDVVKPWPVRQSQALPGGWGVTIDDVLAAVYVNLATLMIWAGRLWWRE
ncbi:MAG: phosphatidylglycerophosphatase A [Verrucomicrobiota bacterium]